MHHRIPIPAGFVPCAVHLLVASCSGTNLCKFRSDADKFALYLHLQSAILFCKHIGVTGVLAVQGLLAFKQSLQDPAGVLESWNTSILPEPCSTANCSSSSSAQDCDWAGIACQNWQIVALVVPCTVLSDGSHTGCALMGSPLDILTQVGQAGWHCCLELAQAAIIFSALAHTSSAPTAHT